jgi:hypothetical protein
MMEKLQIKYKFGDCDVRFTVKYETSKILKVNGNVDIKM